MLFVSKMKKQILVALTLVFASFSGALNAQIYSFEDGQVPSAFTTNGGSLAVSGTKFKLANKSLCWDWKAGSKLTISNPTGLEDASKSRAGGIYLWVYNTVPTDSKLVFAFLDNADQEKCRLDYNLNFKGWRCIVASFAAEMKKDKSALTKMIVEAPGVGNGRVYFDHLEFQKSIPWTRMTNSQYKVVQSPVVEDFMAIRAAGEIKTLIQPTALQLAAVDTIAKRLEQWYTGSGKYTSKSEFNARYNAVARQIKFGLNNTTGDLNLTVASDGTVSGVGLYSSTEPKKMDGITIRTFREVGRGPMLPLAYDFVMNKSALSKTRYLNMLDWMYDQGRADGSSLGSMRDEKLQSAGYFHSLFIMRNELGADRLNRELNTLNWLGLFGHVNELTPEKGENSDDIRSLAVAKLAYALMQPNPEKQATALSLLTKYFNHAFAITPGLLETFKPDFSGYHHAGIYYTQYYPEALYAATWLYYLLHDTPYSLSDEVYSTLKNCLLTYKNVCSVYDAPVSTCGRFPLGGQFLDETLPAFAYLALSKKQPDTELLAAFGRLWKPNESPIKENLNSASTGICLRSTLGETEMCLQAAALNVVAEASPKTAFYLPYSGLMIHRDTKNYVAIKGFSKYVWDYESSATENVYGRYLCYGQIEYTNLLTGKRNSNYENNLWDWSRLPGVTSKHLLSADFKYTDKITYRNFSDKAFLGGTALNDSISMFSMQLHDNAYDKTFSANKSVFCFGNVLVCLGSNINDSAKSVCTETTLFQQDLKDGDKVKLNGKSLNKDLNGLENVVMKDNIGTVYIVKSGLVDIIKTDSMATAVINHGFAPQNKLYGYFMLLQASEAQEKKFANSKTCPVSLLRQDEVAHIVSNIDEKTCGYAIFDTSKALNDKWIQQVNIPSIVMLKELGNSKLILSLTDPDMHRPSVSGLYSLTKEVAEAASQSFDYEIILNGRFALDGNFPNVRLTITDKTTKIGLQVVDGKSYKITLKLL
jgi:chondroitin-sulfate-ABC endolyase/exolyase